MSYLEVHRTHKHLSTQPGPCSSYSALLTHSCWNVPSDAKMEPPIHAENSRSSLLAVTMRGLKAAGMRVRVSQ